jgi:hypothetical protein
MKYMLLIYGNHETWNSLTEETGGAIMRAHEVLQKELTASGELVDTHELDITDARVVRSSNGVPAVTDGPFAEAKEILAGYYILDCGAERAVEIAGRLAEAEFAPVDVRLIKGA